MFDGDTNYIGAISDNNGIREKIGQIPLFGANCITVNYNGSVGEAFYQVKPFWPSDDVNVLFLKDRLLDENIAMFLITLIKANRYRYSYGRKWTLDKMEETEILLPVTESGKIDWDYIEDYISQLRNKHITTNITPGKLNLDFTKWKEFRIGDIFKCSICDSEDFGALSPGNKLFVGRTSENNGIQGSILSDTITGGNCITIGMVGSFAPFWQEDDFVASQNILRLSNKNLNKYSALFVTTCLKELIRGKYSYNRPIQKQKFIDELISLPEADGKPDFVYMENYIKSLSFSDRI